MPLPILRSLGAIRDLNPEATHNHRVARFVRRIPQIKDELKKFVITLENSVVPETGPLKSPLSLDTSHEEWYLTHMTDARLYTETRSLIIWGKGAYGARGGIRHDVTVEFDLRRQTGRVSIF